MPVVTAIRVARPGRVAVELDGARWRTLPAEAVLQAGLKVGAELDRTSARTLRRELRRLEALNRAARALGARELSVHEVEVRLRRGRFTAAERTETIAVLGRAGAVDDGRAALVRATGLAERGYGDSWIRWDLERRGIATELIAVALDALEPERVRAERLATSLGNGTRAASRLARRGFGEEAIEAAVPVATEG